MAADAKRVEDLESADLARLLMDMLHRIVIHHGLWFAEVRHQMGAPKALETLDTVLPKSLGVQLNRLSRILGFEVRDNLPAAWLDRSKEDLLALMKAVAANWLANDGIWFQAVEFTEGMNDAKRCNDSCWAHFSPFEAWSIRNFLNLGTRPGLEGLKKALNFRLYARINRQSFHDEGDDSFVFQMNACRVQEARKRKGLADYPCQSAGTVEYTYFARAIDERIRTQRIACPPDEHPPEWYCAWRFSLAASS